MVPGSMYAPSFAAREPPAVEPALVPDREARLARLAGEHFQFIWRSLRRLGVPPSAVDDAAQQVFEVAARRLEDIERGRERAFLFKTALFVATDARRLAARSRARDGGDIDALHDAAPTPEDSALLGEKRLFLDRVLSAMTNSRSCRLPTSPICSVCRAERWRRACAARAKHFTSRSSACAPGSNSKEVSRERAPPFARSRK
jgi:hypothetical protein